jgi:hypothetical protein
MSKKRETAVTEMGYLEGRHGKLTILEAGLISKIMAQPGCSRAGIYGMEALTAVAFSRSGTSVDELTEAFVELAIRGVLYVDIGAVAVAGVMLRRAQRPNVARGQLTDLDGREGCRVAALLARDLAGADGALLTEEERGRLATIAGSADLGDGGRHDRLSAALDVAFRLLSAGGDGVPSSEVGEGDGGTTCTPTGGTECTHGGTTCTPGGTKCIPSVEPGGGASAGSRLVSSSTTGELAESGVVRAPKLPPAPPHGLQGKQDQEADQTAACEASTLHSKKIGDSRPDEEHGDKKSETAPEKRRDTGGVDQGVIPRDSVPRTGRIYADLKGLVQDAVILEMRTAGDQEKFPDVSYRMKTLAQALKWALGMKRPNEGGVFGETLLDSVVEWLKDCKEADKMPKSRALFVDLLEISKFATDDVRLTWVCDTLPTLGWRTVKLDFLEKRFAQQTGDDKKPADRRRNVPRAVTMGTKRDYDF